MAFLLPPIGIDVAIFLVIYATAAWGTRTVMWAGLVSSFVGAGFITIYLMGFGSAFGYDSGFGNSLANGIFILIVMLLAWAFGLVWRAYRRSEQRHTQAREADARATEEAERTAIARDMHDVVAHSLAVVIAQANGARYAAATDPEVTKQALETISQTAGDALKDVRVLLAQLRHRQGQLPQATLADVDTLFDQVRVSGRELTVDIEGDILNPPGPVQLAAYRVLQEAISNALRHSEGPISARLRTDDATLELTVSNPTEHEPNVGGHGLIGMRERVALVGGGLRTGRVGDNFVVDAFFPFTRHQVQS